VAESVTFAEDADYPEPSQIYTEVYQQEDYPFITE
jgi:pyruvate dehydrogenase E1 component alpha subunit